MLIHLKVWVYEFIKHIVDSATNWTNKCDHNRGLNNYKNLRVSKLLYKSAVKQNPLSTRQLKNEYVLQTDYSNLIIYGYHH